MNVIKREQLAAQIVALMGADFERPNADEMEIILERAKSQIRDAATVQALPRAEAKSLGPDR